MARVTRCVCHDISFADILLLAAETGATEVWQVQMRRPFGFSCGQCIPYVRRVLRTGETELEVGEIDEAPPPSTPGRVRLGNRS